ncbi:hypothetical protein [Pseudonocardia spinosispora]|uniref:hypothetical protein n=1 Tax=Pseudonocardia spinosispora TaxID=103441 RepID=UPI00040B0ABB|nr:hypothetical protein [Pseudonocardia spinosispora]
MSRKTKSGKNAASTLDRRRETLLARTSAADESATKLSTLEEELRATSQRKRDDEASLSEALIRIAELKKAIKSAEKRRTKLRSARKDARQDHTEARRRAEVAEAKYDRAVLADLLRREKDRDLAAHAARQPTPVDPAAAESPEAQGQPSNGLASRALSGPARWATRSIGRNGSAEPTAATQTGATA